MNGATPTGSGKSLAYLVPSALWAVGARDRVVVGMRPAHLLADVRGQEQIGVHATPDDGLAERGLVQLRGARRDDDPIDPDDAEPGAPDDGATVSIPVAVLNQIAVVGAAGIPTTVGRRTAFGHRCLVIGATIGDLCEVGNASILMPGGRRDVRIRVTPSHTM